MKSLPNKAAELIPCPCADNLFINELGNVVPQHDLDPNFDLNEYVMQLREKKLQWKQIYWRLWATTTLMYCSVCHKYFRAVDFQK